MVAEPPRGLRAELARPSWKREFVAIGAATDPYQPAEGRYRLTRVMEPGAPPPRGRLEAVRRLVAAGIRTQVAMAPILPGISDAPARLEAAVRAVREAGATGAWAGVVNLRPGTREHFLAAVAREWPEPVPAYERLFQGRAYLAKSIADPIVDRAGDLKREAGVADRRTLPLEPPPEPGQMVLPV